MSYLVLARKWRPQVFSEVIGQDHVTLTLKKAVEKGRLAHAYLFAGPRGCGKTTTARLLAKVINCNNPEGSEPCNECPSCRAIMEGRHLDVIEIDGASNRGIDEIRDLREKIGYAPSQGGSKIYIIDEVHMLTPQAFNALLKTLEEPPSHVYLVFATTEPHKVPPTIMSRCQRFNFKRLELGEIFGQLEKISELEKFEYDGDALLLISRRAEGSMRDAESLLDQCISAAEGKIDIELVRLVLGLVDSHLIVELLAAVGGRNRRAALEIVDRVVSSGLDLEEFFLAYIEGLRNLLVLSVEGKDSAQWLDLGGREIEELERVGENFRTEDLLFLFRSASKAFREFKGSSQPRYHLEAAIAEAASWESAVELSALLRRLDLVEGSGGGVGMVRGGSHGQSSGSSGGIGSGEDGELQGPADGMTAEGGKVEDKSATTSARASGKVLEDETQHGTSLASTGAFARIDRAPLDKGGVIGLPAHDPYEELGGRERWERFLSQVREAKLTLGIWLMSADVKMVMDDRLILDFNPQNRFAREMILEEKNKRCIESLLERFFGRRLHIETGESGEIVPLEHRQQIRERQVLDPEVKKLVEKTPMVRRLIEEFDGELFKEDQH